MLFNITVGLIIPWMLGVWLYNKNKKILLTIFPFSSIVSLTINSFGYHLDFWKVGPINLGTLAMLPFDLGLYAVLGSLLIYIIFTKNINPYRLIFIFSFATTLLEMLMVIVGKVVYGANWNIFYTFFSYLLPYTFVYWYSLSITKIKVL